jgi:hypothetical protein
VISQAGAASAESIGPRGRRLGAGVLATLALSAALLLGIGAPIAVAAPEAGPGWAHRANFGGFEYFGFDAFRTPVAVDGGGNIFGSDENQGLVKIFSPGPDGGTSLAEVAAGARNIAVDPSGGSIYADGPFGGPVRRFVSNGTPVPSYTFDPAFGEIPAGEGLAVDPTTSDLLVADSGAEGVRRYDSGGTLLETIATPSINPAWIVSASDGSFYVAPVGGPDVTHFSGAGALLGTISGVGSLHGLAYDPSRSVVVVAVGDQLRAYSPAGALLAKSAAQGGGGIGLAVGTSGSLYEHTGGSLNFYVPGTVPGVEAPHVSAIAITSALASAEVDPGPGPPESSVAHFEVSADGGLTWPEQFKTPDVSVERTGTAEPDTVEADLTGLKGNTDYVVRLVAANSIITAISGSTPFHTTLGPPEVETGPAISIADNKAELTGTIDTLGAQTTYRFEYGLTSSYGSKVPVGIEAVAGNERSQRSFSLEVSGLQSGMIYHYRLVARNAAGESVGADRTFTTATAGQPKRAYERVSPAEKMGGAISSLMAVQASADGSGVMYALSAAPANTESAVLQTRVVSRRTPDGWLDWRPLDPPQKVIPSITQKVSQAISPDFTHAMVVSNLALTPVAPSGPFQGGGNIYIKDLRSGEYTFVAGAAGSFAYNRLSALFTSTTYLAGASDFGWVIFAAPVPLAGTGTSEAALYKWSRAGGLEVESRLPETNAIASGAVRRPSCCVEPWTLRMNSDDGETFYFSLDSGEGGVYRRSGGQSTAISVSHRNGDDPSIIYGGVLDGVSADGRYAFFHTGTPLTDDTPSEEFVPYLYRYDTTDNDLEFVAGSISGTTSGASQFIWGVGDDGRTIYFQKNANGIGSWAWRDGAMHRVSSSALPVNNQVFISPNGRFMAYAESDESLHLYDAVKEEEVCVSCDPHGDRGELPASERTLGNRAPEVASNAGTMFFTSTNSLLAEDHNASSDVYQYKDGELTLVSPGDGPYDAYFGDATPDASNVYFTTNEPLVSGDKDGAIDLYDARIGGGFAGTGVVAPECEGESCRAPIPAPPSLPVGKAGAKDVAISFSIRKVRTLSAADRMSLARGGKARLRLTVNRPGTVSLSGKAKIGGARAKVVAVSVRAKNAGDIGIPFALSQAALTELNRKGSLMITLRVSFGDAKSEAVHLTLKANTNGKGGRS